MMKLAILLVLSMVFPLQTFAGHSAPPLSSTPSDWLDQQPLTWKDLKGNVVLLNVWTFGCWNSYRSLPWVVSLKTKFPELRIIGIHSPEFAYEKDRNRLRKVMAEYKVNDPQLLDDDLRYWRQLHNRYWPAFYVVDRNGQIRGTFAGETHAHDPQAKRIEKLIESLSKK